MRIVIQRVAEASVWIDGHQHSRIGHGLLILIGCRTGDKTESTAWLAEKTRHLRIFEDADQKMNLSVTDISGEILVVSQFTLYADSRKGRRPAFTEAMEPREAEELYLRYVDALKSGGLSVQTGVFGAKMEVKLVNDGPVTILLDHEL